MLILKNVASLLGCKYLVSSYLHCLAQLSLDGTMCCRTDAMPIGDLTLSVDWYNSGLGQLLYEAIPITNNTLCSTAIICRDH